jgi:beta-lactamase superfamily II metal-dependent hydrolase
MSTRFLARPVLIGAAATAVISCVAGYVWMEQHRPRVLEIYVFALKSGRSMFIRTPDDERILIDGGGNSQVIQRLTDIIPFYSRRVDAIIITNTDGKNVSGLVDVVHRYNVGRVYVPRVALEGFGLASSTDLIYETFLESVAEKKIPLRELGAGDLVPLSADVSLRVLFPVTVEEFEYSKASAPEVLFTLTYKNNSVIFLGDASKKVQKFVVASHLAASSSPPITRTDALIVSHSAGPANMSIEIMRTFNPLNLIYEKSVTNSKPRPAITKSSLSSSKKKAPIDPLAGILMENRFNVKEGTVKMVSDGTTLQISKENPE